jgi:DNA-binding NarL/FixJ family response regulator
MPHRAPITHSGRISKRYVGVQGEARVRRNILLIDDDPAEAGAIRTALAGRGNASFQVSWVRRCSEGIERLGAEDRLRAAHQAPGIAAIVLDLYLRDSHGIETFIQLFRAAPRIPILVLAAAYDEHVARAAVQLGAQDYMLKSMFSGCLLPRTLQSMVERSRQAQLPAGMLCDDIRYLS